jgi:hypothetical protein
MNELRGKDFATGFWGKKMISRSLFWVGTGRLINQGVLYIHFLKWTLEGRCELSICSRGPEPSFQSLYLMVVAH